MAMLKLAWRLLNRSTPRQLWKLAWNMGLGGALSVQRHKARLKRGEFFPPFLYVSIINSCNLRCQGCWVDVAAKQEIIQPDAFGRLVREARQLGNVTPLISVEGNEVVSDVRRGRPGVLNKTLERVRNCLRKKVFTGVCT